MSVQLFVVYHEIVTYGVLLLIAADDSHRQLFQRLIVIMECVRPSPNGKGKRASFFIAAVKCLNWHASAIDCLDEATKNSIWCYLSVLGPFGIGRYNVRRKNAIYSRVNKAEQYSLARINY